MSHIQEGLDQSPPSAKPAESEAYSNQTEGSQNGRPHFERFPMRIVTIPVHRDVPELVHNKEAASDAKSEGSQTAPPAYTMKDLKAAIKSMMTEDKEKFLDDMALDLDQDF